MARLSAAKDLWPWRVRDWCEHKWGAPRRRLLPAPNGRLPFELDTFIALANDGSTEHAKAIVMHFYLSLASHKPVDTKVLQYLEEARQRYAADRKPSMQKALLLTRRRRGNPGATRGRHELSPEGRIEVAEMVLEKVHGTIKGEPVTETRAVKDVAAEWNVSERTVWAAIAELKKITEVNSGNKPTP